MPALTVASRRAVLTLLFLFLLSAFIVTPLLDASWASPPPPGDGPDYENIAFELSLGHGFRYDYGNEQWRRPYLEANDDGRYNELALRNASQTTTVRPPFLSFLISVVYRIAGRNFLAWRLLDSLILATALSLACALGWDLFGGLVAIFSSILMLASATYLDSARDGFLTEPLALLLLVLLLRTVNALFRRPLLRYAVGGGFCLGLLGLTRSVYALWLLPVSLLLAVLLWQDRISKERAKLALLLLVSAFLVQLPWWLRNGQLLHKPLSLGTQGDLNLYAAFGEAAYRHQGAWWNAVETDGRVAFVDELGRDCKECDEVELANYLSGGARRWVARHPLKTLQLAWWKIRGSWSHLPATGWIGGVLWLGMAAPFVLWRRRRALSAEAIAPVFLAIALTHLFIAATWSTGWRFLVPIEPLLILLSSVTLTALFFGEAAIGTFRDDPPRSPI